MRLFLLFIGSAVLCAWSSLSIYWSLLLKVIYKNNLCHGIKVPSFRKNLHLFLPDTWGYYQSRFTLIQVRFIHFLDHKIDMIPGWKTTYSFPEGIAFWGHSSLWGESPNIFLIFCGPWALISMPLFLWDHQSKHLYFRELSNAFRVKVISLCT